MKKRVTFIGNQDAPDGRPMVEAFGETYRLAVPRILELAPDVVSKLEGNSHFLVEDAPVADAEVSSVNRLTPEQIAEMEAARASGEPLSGAASSPPAFEEASEGAGDDDRIEVTRARPRAGRASSAKA